MKKVLFATSALVALAGVASAEVAVTGDGRMGMIYDGEDVQFSSRARAKFNMTGETDSGLSFGGSFRVDQENYSFNPDGRSAAHGTAGSVYISGTYGKLSMGDVVSAAEAAMGDLVELGYTDGDYAFNPEEIDYLTGDGENEEQGVTALYEYTFNGVNLFASLTDGSRRDCGAGNAMAGDLPCYDLDGNMTSEDTDMAFSLAAGYEFGAYNVALAYSDDGTATEFQIGGTAAFDAWKIKGFYADYSDREQLGLGEIELDVDANYDKAYGLSVEYAMVNGVGLQALWITRELEFTGPVASAVTDKDTFDAYGIGATYDLGSGAVLAGSIIKNEMLLDNETRADMGVKFKF